MEVTLDSLKGTYARLSTEQLVGLRAKGTLTAMAQSVVDEELRLRGLGDSEVLAAASRVHEANQALEEDTSRLASLDSRLVAHLIDVYGILLLLAALNYVVFLYAPESFSNTLGSASIVLWLFYILVKDSFSGQSVGKRILQIRVLDARSGLPCSAPKSIVRNAMLSLGVFDALPIFGSSHKRIGDLVAGTYVVKG